ncbi:MAG: PD-(D/E)XK nuclease family transposase [Desulfamplus sp.]|nr:PD-(D/E)XK nuclease family transposase [Desulfamplus sp.]
MNDYLMSPKNDFVFKLIFGDEKNKHILIAFLTNVLNMSEGELADIKIINSELLREFKEDKKGILDVRAQTKDGEQINIEIQILPTEFMPERTLFYWAKMFVSQIKSGDTYDKLKRCITINIVDFECTPLKQLHSCYHLIEDNTGHKLTDIEEIHFMELPKLFDPATPIDENDPITQWMMFINAKSREVIEMLAQKNKHIGSAFDLLQIIAQDEKARMLYEARQAEIMDQLTRIKSAQTAILKAKAEGIKEGEEKMVKAMLLRGMTIEETASIADMDISKVTAIKNSQR